MTTEASLYNQLAQLLAPHHPPKDNFENEVYRQQQRLIVEVGYLLGWVIIITTMLVAAVFAPTAPTWKILIWAGPLWTYSAFILFSFRKLRGKKQPKKVSGKLLKFSEYGGFLVGGQYSLAVLLFPNGSATAELFAVAMTAGMGAGVTSVMSTLPRFCFRFLAGAALFLTTNTILRMIGSGPSQVGGDLYYILLFEGLVVVLFAALIVGATKNHQRLVRLVSTTQQSREARETLFNAIEATTDAFALLSSGDDIKIANRNHSAWFPKASDVLRSDSDSYTLENGRRVKRASQELENGDKVVVHSDITDLYNKQVELERARQEAEEADHAKSRFLSGMSHELRTPLHIIIGYSSLMEEQSNITFSKEEMKENSTRIHRAGRDLLKFVDNMLEYSQIEQQFTQGSFELVPLHEVLEQQIAQKLKSEPKLKRSQISLGAEKSAGEVVVNSELANRIISELLENAVKFRGQDDPRVIVRAGMASGHIIVSVTDFGRGMSEEMLENAFIPFSSKNKNNVPDSSGIGLSLCRHVARLAGGDVRLISEVDKGTTAYWILGQRSYQSSNVSEDLIDRAAS
ncbi:MAG: HAMP domain-containing sensor histidine kinase [Pseudomonadota bacterium]